MRIIGDHILYGHWDDCGGYQFLVYYHPNGKNGTVFLLGGCDYGGGVTSAHDVKTQDLDKVIKENKGDPYTLYEAVRKFCEYQSPTLVPPEVG